ncbi:MAG: hypothetical protein WC861_04635 [Candidatus Micrarchaeia archaeon]|jgi:hypothetical protein
MRFSIHRKRTLPQDEHLGQGISRKNVLFFLKHSNRLRAFSKESSDGCHYCRPKESSKLFLASIRIVDDSWGWACKSQTYQAYHLKSLEPVYTLMSTVSRQISEGGLGERYGIASRTLKDARIQLFTSLGLVAAFTGLLSLPLFLGPAAGNVEWQVGRIISWGLEIMGAAGLAGSAYNFRKYFKLAKPIVEKTREILALALAESGKVANRLSENA